MKGGLLLFILLLSTPVLAWKGETHEAFVEAFYYSIDNSTRARLDLYWLRRGAVDPDAKFRDFTRHSYPHSVTQAERWRTVAREALARGDRKNASHAFGVVSHYISDTFAAPHMVHGEEAKDHYRYEEQAMYEYVYVPCAARLFSLEDELRGALVANTTWKQWEKTKNATLPRAQVAKAMNLVYAVGLDLFHGTCDEPDFRAVPLSWYESFLRRPGIELGLMGGSVILICLVAYSLKRDLKDCSEQFDEPVDDAPE